MTVMHSDLAKLTVDNSRLYDVRGLLWLLNWHTEAMLNEIPGEK